MLNRRAILLAGLAAGCSTSDDPAARLRRNGWVYDVPGGGFIRVAYQYQQLGSCPETAREIMFADERGGQTAQHIDVSIGASNTAVHSSLEDFYQAAMRRRYYGECDAAAPAREATMEFEEDARPRRRILWEMTNRSDGELRTMLLWESQEAPLRLYIWSYRDSRAEVLSLAERIGRTFTLVRPADY